jgi:ferredoxin
VSSGPHPVSALGRLKTIRVVVSLAFLGGITLLFLDLTSAIPPSVAGTVTAFQLVPAVVKSLGMFGLWTIGAGTILLLTLLFGRVYCSSICPVGTLQDLFIRLRREVVRRERYRFRKPMALLHYGVLAGSAILFALGSLTVLNLLEPFSNYGRIVTALGKPAAVGMNNILAALAGTIGWYGLAVAALHTVGLGAIGSALLFLGTVGYLSYRHGRLFCNTLCPAGAILSLLSRFAIFKIVVDHSTCLECGLCERVCKAECIDSDNKRIAFEACVGCFNCIQACPTVGLKFSKPWDRSTGEVSVDSGRRRVLAASVAPFAGLFAGAPDSTRVPGVLKESLRPVTPPGAMGERHFTENCTACHLCVSVCPSHVLAPTFLAYGVAGLLQPHMDYAASYCNYDCTACGTACPSGAIRSLSQETKRLVQIGQARFLKDECVVVKNKKDCGACSEHCPTKAVHMVPYEGKLVIPELTNDLCVGCGACEHACPTRPQRAIYVEANPVHLQAKKPEIRKLEPEKLPAGEFPF